jgi:cell wall-associated NlpC family hydrolase
LRLRIRHIRIGIAALAVALATAAVATADPTVSGKQQEAQQIIGQINAMDARLEQAVQRYDLANVKLQRIGHDLARTRYDLTVARTNLNRAQVALGRQAAAVYTSTDSNSTLEVLLGATSLDDLLNRLDNVNRISDQRSSLLGDVARFRTQIAQQVHQLQHAQAEQRSVVAQRAAERASIQSELSRRRALLSSVKSQIAHLQAVERARSLQIARTIRPQPQQSSTGTVVGVSASTPEATVAPPARYGGVVGIAMQYLGVPYVWGGASPSGFDCSGLVMYVFAQVGVSLPHSTYAQWGMGVPVSRDQLQPGDLVFFDGLGHVGIYVGGGSFIHAPHTGTVVQISSLSGWYASSYVGARRIL